MKNHLNHTLISSLLECKLGTIKEADCPSDDQSLRAVIENIRLNENAILSGWMLDDHFINKNEQGPIEVFAHFLNLPKNMLIVLNGISTITAIHSQGALVGIKIISINALKR